MCALYFLYIKIVLWTFSHIFNWWWPYACRCRRHRHHRQHRHSSLWPPSRPSFVVVQRHRRYSVVLLSSQWIMKTTWLKYESNLNRTHSRTTSELYLNIKLHSYPSYTHNKNAGEPSHHKTRNKWANRLTGTSIGPVFITFIKQ